MTKMSNGKLHMIGQCSALDIKEMRELILKELENPENKGKDLSFADYKEKLSKNQQSAWKVVIFHLNKRIFDKLTDVKLITLYANEQNKLVRFEYTYQRKI